MSKIEMATEALSNAKEFAPAPIPGEFDSSGCGGGPCVGSPCNPGPGGPAPKCAPVPQPPRPPRES